MFWCRFTFTANSVSTTVWRETRFTDRIDEMVEETWQDGFSTFFNRTWQQTTATARAHNPEALGVENCSTPQARFREGYREIPHDSRKTSEMSNAKLFNDVGTMSKRCMTMSKYSDDENVDFSFFDEFNSLSYVESDDYKRFSRQLRTYLPLRSSRYDVYNSRYWLSKFSYFNTLVDFFRMNERLA